MMFYSNLWLLLSKLSWKCLCVMLFSKWMQRFHQSEFKLMQRGTFHFRLSIHSIIKLRLMVLLCSCPIGRARCLTGLWFCHYIRSFLDIYVRMRATGNWSFSGILKWFKVVLKICVICSPLCKLIGSLWWLRNVLQVLCHL